MPGSPSCRLCYNLFYHSIQYLGCVNILTNKINVLMGILMAKAFNVFYIVSSCIVFLEMELLGQRLYILLILDTYCRISF